MLFFLVGSRCCWELFSDELHKWMEISRMCWDTWDTCKGPGISLSLLGCEFSNLDRYEQTGCKASIGS
jgi:hypothetical protein